MSLPDLETHGLSAVALALCPDVTADGVGKDIIANAEVFQQEIIFVVDRSGAQVALLFILSHLLKSIIGSMSGSCIESVRECLSIVIRSLPADTTLFNLVGFGSGYEVMFLNECTLHHLLVVRFINWWPDKALPVRWSPPRETAESRKL